MAIGACRLFAADWAVATTGYAEPAPAAGVAVPFAWVAVAGSGGAAPRVQVVRRIECPGAGRTDVQSRVADAAVQLLADTLRTTKT
jgi:nicotinamide-nucleotide amidase